MIIKTPQTELFHSYCRTKYRTFMGERSSKDVDAVNGYITAHLTKIIWKNLGLRPSLKKVYNDLKYTVSTFTHLQGISFYPMCSDSVH